MAVAATLACAHVQNEQLVHVPKQVVGQHAQLVVAQVPAHTENSVASAGCSSASIVHHTPHSQANNVACTVKGARGNAGHAIVAQVAVVVVVVRVHGEDSSSAHTDHSTLTWQ